MAQTKHRYPLTARPAAADAQELAADLRELIELHRAGVLTKGELVSERARLLWTPRVVSSAPRRAKPARARQRKAG